MKKGKILAGHFSRTHEEPYSAVMIEITGEDHRTIVTVELTYEQYGKLLSGRGSIDMKYKEYKR